MTLFARWLLGAAIVLAFGAGAMAVPDETAVVAELTAADHEAAEGYFSLGDGATLVARPGSDLHRWLTAHRGQTVRLGLGLSREVRSRDHAITRSSPAPRASRLLPR